MAKADKLPHVSTASDNTVFTHSVFLFLLSVENVVVNNRTPNGNEYMYFAQPLEDSTTFDVGYRQSRLISTRKQTLDPILHTHSCFEFIEFKKNTEFHLNQRK